MTLSTSTNTVQYTATSSQTDFTIPYKFFEDSDIKVLHDQSGTETLITSGFSIVDKTDTGATLRFDSGLNSGTKVRINRIVPETQTLDLSATGVFPAESVETSLDRLAAQMQQALGRNTTDGTTMDAESLRIVNVTDGSASGDAINKSQLDAITTRVLAVEQAANIGEGSSLNVPSPSGQANNNMLIVTSNAYAVATPTTVRANMSLATSDNVTFANITGTDLTCDGNVVLGNGTGPKTVTVNDDLIVAGGQIKSTASGNKIGVNIDHASAKGSVHIIHHSEGAVTGATANAAGDTLVIEEDDTNSGMSILSPEPASATQFGNIYFGSPLDNNMGGIVYSHKQNPGSGNGTDDALTVRVGGSSYATFNKNGSSTATLDFGQSTRITGLAEPSASTDAATLNTVQQLAGFRVAEFALFSTIAPGGAGSRTLDVLQISSNVGGGADSYNVFANSTNWITVDTSNNKFTLQPGTYKFSCTGGLLIGDSTGFGNGPVNIDEIGPYLASSASGGVTQSSNRIIGIDNIINDDGGHSLTPREGMRKNSTNNSAPDNSRNVLEGFQAGIEGMNGTGQTVIGIQGVKTFTGTQDIFPRHVYKDPNSSILNGLCVGYSLVVTKLDGNV